MVLYEAYVKAYVGKHLSGTLSQLLFNFAVEYIIREVQEDWILGLTVTLQLAFCADDVNLLGKTINIIKNNTEALLSVN